MALVHCTQVCAGVCPLVCTYMLLCMLQDEALDDKDALYAVFEDLIKGTDFSFKQGDVVAGTVFEIDQKGAYVDIGAKSAAFCPTAEVSLCKVSRVRGSGRVLAIAMCCCRGCPVVCQQCANLRFQ